MGVEKLCCFVGHGWSVFEKRGHRSLNGANWRKVVQRCGLLVVVGPQRPDRGCLTGRCASW